MDRVAFALGWMMLALALGGALYALLSARAVRRFAQAKAPQPASFPDVTLLKPLHGAEEGLLANLESFCVQDYPGAVQIVFGVQDARDPAIAVVEALQAKYPAHAIVLAIGAPASGNPKIANLVSMMPHAVHEVLVHSDSDIAVTPDYLRIVIGALQTPGIGAVTCFYAGRAQDNLWSRLAAMGIDYQFLPNVIFATQAGVAAPCFGSTVALTRACLTAIGGFENFRGLLADDYEIGRAVRAQGHAIAYPPLVVGHDCPERSLSALFRHELRWARTIRGIDPKGHAGSFITHSFALGLIGTALAGGTLTALAALGAIVAARAYQMRSLDGLLKRPAPSFWLFPLRDMLSFVVFVSSFFVKQVDWRGRLYALHGSGDLA
jgi:ceramide glucosyltransferase